jgi:hypothetical protein
VNQDFSAYIKQKAAVQQLLKTPTSPPIIGSPSMLNGLLKSQLSHDSYLDQSSQNHQNNFIYDFDNNAANSIASMSSLGSLGSLSSPQQQLAAANLLMNFLKSTNQLANNNSHHNSQQHQQPQSEFLFGEKFMPNSNLLFPFSEQAHQQTFDSIVNSTIKEMIDDDFEEEDFRNKSNNVFDENNNDLTSVVDSSNSN